MYYYARYEKRTGQITGYFKSSTREFLPKPPSPEHENIEITDPEHIALLQALNPGTVPHGKVEGGKIALLQPISRSALSLKANKIELNGDGEDKAVIEVQVVDGHGKPIRNYNETIRVTTDRGKLSERGGLVKMVHGYARIELTSVNETVQRVRVRAESREGSASPGELVLEFV